jgi:hypothetical protein
LTVRKKQGKGLKSRKYESKGSVTTSAQRADGQSDLLCPQRSAVCPASGSTGKKTEERTVGSAKRSDRTFRHRTGFLCGLLPPSVTGYLAGSCQGGRKNGAQPVQLDELPVFQRRGEACGFRQFYFYEGVPAFAKGIEDRTG